MTDATHRSLASAALGLALALVSANASAHLGHVVENAERYVKLDAHEGELRVVVSITLGAAEGRRALDAADTNEDGRLDDAEVDAHVRGYADTLDRDLRLTIDDAPMPWRLASLRISPRGPAVPRAVEFEVRQTLREGTHRLTLHDSGEGPSFDRTDVALHAREGARLEASGAGATLRTPALRRISYAPPSGPRHIASARFWVPAAPVDRAPMGWALLVCLGVGIVAVGLARGLSQRR